MTRAAAQFGERRYDALFGQHRYATYLAEQRYGAEFGLPGDAYTETVIAYLLINAAGDKLSINASGDTLGIA